MAIFFPSLDKINQFRVPPTDGERSLLNFLERNLDNSYEVYFNPYLNGDRPDVIIMREGYGVLIIEVKDWNLANYRLNEKKHWVYTPNNSVVKSPIDQVLKYKNNLYDLHIPELLGLKIQDIRNFNIVSCAVYFYCASQRDIENLLVTPFADDNRYQSFLKYNIDFIGNDSLNRDAFDALLKKRHIVAKNRSFLFTSTLYNNFKRILSPSIHLLNQGEQYNYTTKQKEIIYSRTLEQRVRGVFGSGKTTVLAARAVQAYKRALFRNPQPRILILTFNITLKNFIHDKLNRVHEEFPPASFIIINYHQFINSELNNLNIVLEVPPEEEIITILTKRGVDIESKDESSRRRLINRYQSDYLESHYYGNVGLFEKHKEDIVKYDAVLIDEIQDYHRPWMDIIKNYFRDPDGDYVLFGDVKQNIYGQKTEHKDVITNVHGVNELKYCFRADFKVKELAKKYQTDVFQDKYDIDDFSENENDYFFGQKIEKQGYINYMYLSDPNLTTALYNIIRGNITNKDKNISANDITILGYTTLMLRKFDAYYRYASREKTNSMLETTETMYIRNLNYCGDFTKNDSDHKWFSELGQLLATKLFPQKGILNDNDKVRIKTRIAVLFTIYDLYSEFEGIFDKRLEEECIKCNITLKDFLDIRKKYSNDLKDFAYKVSSTNYKDIRDNKKLHFWMNSGTIKISTINSFKGWESEALFLILEPRYDNENEFNVNFDELLYTGITRCRRNLVVINFGNAEYDRILRPLFNECK